MCEMYDICMMQRIDAHLKNEIEHLRAESPMLDATCYEVVPRVPGSILGSISPWLA